MIPLSTSLSTASVNARRCVLAFALLASLPVAAVTLTFNNFAHDQSEVLTGPYTGNFTYQSFVEGGFTVSIIPSPWIVWGRSNPRNADLGGATLTNLDGRARTAFEPLGYGLFTLNSFQVASFYNGAEDESGFGRTFTVRFNGDITTDQVFTIDNLPGLQTFTFNRSGVSGFEIRNAYLQIDNVVLNEPTAPVPEVPAWALMAAGLGSVAAWRRRQEQRLQVR